MNRALIGLVVVACLGCQTVSQVLADNVRHPDGRPVEFVRKDSDVCMEKTTTALVKLQQINPDLARKNVSRKLLYQSCMFSLGYELRYHDIGVRAVSPEGEGRSAVEVPSACWKMALDAGDLESKHQKTFGECMAARGYVVLPWKDR